ncbi:hypothetical protein [Arenimonas malthae]|uniref:hypothetical protein n=1 Tax=Arenimonas malthae TaxID=354197 RepID=UPI0012EBD9AF|nr:hypothetical protein [Arenimonas malthae]
MKAMHQLPPSRMDGAIRWSAREIPLSHGRHVCGRVAWTPPTQSVPVESDLEANAIAFFSRHAGLVAIHAQPFTLRYADDQGVHRYTPDFLVVYDRVTRAIVRLGFRRWTVVEIKSTSLLKRDPDAVSCRLAAVRRLLGFATVVLTECHLRTGRARP